MHMQGRKYTVRIAAVYAVNMATICQLCIVYAFVYILELLYIVHAKFIGDLPWENMYSCSLQKFFITRRKQNRMHTQVIHAPHTICSHVGHVHFALIRPQHLTKFMLTIAPFLFAGRLYHLERTIIV